MYIEFMYTQGDKSGRAVQKGQYIALFIQNILVQQQDVLKRTHEKYNEGSEKYVWQRKTVIAFFEHDAKSG